MAKEEAEIKHKISNLKRNIKNTRKKIDTLNAKISKLEKEERHIITEIASCRGSIDKFEGDLWREEAALNMHKKVRWGDLPFEIMREFNKIKYDIIGDDCIASCEHCSRKCMTEAINEFCNKYNIKTFDL